MVLDGILWFSSQPVCWGMASERAFSGQTYSLEETGNAEWAPYYNGRKGILSHSSRSGRQMSAGHRNVSPVWPEYQLLRVVSFQWKASLTKQEIRHLSLYQAINYYLHRLLAAGTQSEMFCSYFRPKPDLHFVCWSSGLPAWTADSEMYSFLGNRVEIQRSSSEKLVNHPE